MAKTVFVRRPEWPEDRPSMEIVDFALEGYEAKGFELDGDAPETVETVQVEDGATDDDESESD